MGESGLVVFVGVLGAEVGDGAQVLCAAVEVGEKVLCLGGISVMVKMENLGGVSVLNAFALFGASS